jgi:hypothetical protein
MTHFNFDTFTLYFLNIINYCKSIIPNNLEFIYYSIITIITVGVLIHYSARWVKVIVNGVERLVPVTAGGFAINEALGRPIPIPNLGPKKPNDKPSTNPSNKPSNNTSNKPNNNSNSSKNIINTFMNRKNNLVITPYIKCNKDVKLTNRQSLILPFILNILDINLPEGSENLTNYAFGVMTLSLVALLCLINILGYFLSLYILDKYNIENKFPKLNKIKTYYKNTTLIFIIFESLFCIFCLLFLIISAYLYLKNIISTT